MIKDFEVALLLSTELPGMHYQLSHLGGTMNVYKAVQCFADYTIGLVKENKILLMKDCFNIADRMLKEGGTSVKIAVENIYLYSIGMLLDVMPVAGKKVKEVMTPGMLDVCKRQLTANGI